MIVSLADEGRRHLRGVDGGLPADVNPGLSKVNDLSRSQRPNSTSSNALFTRPPSNSSGMYPACGTVLRRDDPDEVDHHSIATDARRRLSSFRLGELGSQSCWRVCFPVFATLHPRRSRAKRHPHPPCLVSFGGYPPFAFTQEATRFSAPSARGVRPSSCAHRALASWPPPGGDGRVTSRSRSASSGRRAPTAATLRIRWAMARSVTLNRPAVWASDPGGPPPRPAQSSTERARLSNGPSTRKHSCDTTSGTVRPGSGNPSRTGAGSSIPTIVHLIDADLCRTDNAAGPPHT
jgi:hypothetical protein